MPRGNAAPAVKRRSGSDRSGSAFRTPRRAYGARAVDGHHSELGLALQSQRIEHFEKLESVESGVPCANLLDAVLAHENGGVRVVADIPGKMRQVCNHLAGNVRMALCRDENAEARRDKQRCDKLPCCRCVPWPTQGPWARRHAEKLIKDWPRRVPGIRSSPRRGLRHARYRLAGRQQRCDKRRCNRRKTPMRTVTVEEHFSVPALASRIDKEAISRRGYRPRKPRPNVPNPLELLPEIGERRLKLMDDAGITVQVLSTSGPGPDLVPGPDGVALARELNEYLAAAVARHPDRFAGFAALPMQSPDA